MTVKIIVEQFNIYNNPEFDDYNAYLPFETNNDLPKFQLRFYVKSPYFSENIHGEIQFSRAIRKKFKEFKTLFCKEFGPIYDRFDNQEPPLELTNRTIHALIDKLHNTFLIPGEIELSSVELIGNWEVYNNRKNSELAQLFNKQLSNDFLGKIFNIIQTFSITAMVGDEYYYLKAYGKIKKSFM